MTEQPNIQPPSSLVMGAPGSGKTDSIITYLEAGIETFVMVTEPDGVGSLLDSCARRRVSVDKLHWQVAPPTAAGLDALMAMTTSIGMLDFEGLSKQKSGIGKDKTRLAAVKVLNVLQDFRCERTGKAYGSFADWDDTRALVIDSLSGISVIAMALTVGYKPTAAQGEWGVAMNWIEQLLLKVNSDRRCFFTLISHVEKELSEMTGVQMVMASTLGRKLAPKIPRFFSEVVWARKNKESGFTWATIDNNAELKNRALPNGDKLEQSFVPIVEAYRRRLVQARSGIAAPASANTKSAA